MYLDTKTDRTLIVSMAHGPIGTATAPLERDEYVAWLDQAGYRDGHELYDPETRRCLSCRKEYTPTTRKMEYCSKACANYASLRRRRQAEMDDKSAL